METKVNYSLVGLFVVVLMTVTIVLILWLSVGLSGTSYHTFRIDMNESVAGLNINSPVQYNGVTVGHVTNIKLNEYNPQQVQLLVAIQTNTPITRSTTATLMSQGLTGIAYLGLRSSSADLTPLTAAKGEDYPLIQTLPSLMMRMDTAVNTLTNNLTQISAALHTLLDGENRQAVEKTMQNISQLTGSLADNSKQLNKALRSANILLNNSAKASVNLPDLLKNGQATLQLLNEQTLPAFNALLSNLNSTSTNLVMLSKTIKQDPSVILRGTTPPQPGPGEH